MQARCQISTSGERMHTFPNSPASRLVPQIINVSPDSKALSHNLVPQIQSSRTPVPSFPMNGRERAITEMPANLKVFHPEAPRRDL